MKSYAIQEKDITAADLEALELSKKILEAIPADLPKPVSCHAIARAVSTLIEGATYEDGYFASLGWCHSWVRLPSNNILDVYPIAASGPFIAVQRMKGHPTFTPWTSVYNVAPVTKMMLEYFGNPDEIARELLNLLSLKGLNQLKTAPVKSGPNRGFTYVLTSQGGKIVSCEKVRNSNKGSR